MTELKVYYMHPEEGVLMHDSYPGCEWEIEEGGVLTIIKGQQVLVMFRDWSKMEVTYSNDG